MRATHTTVLREADTAVGGELRSFDLADSSFEQPGNSVRRSSEIDVLRYWDLRLMFPHEHDEGHIRNAGCPGVTKQLRVSDNNPAGLLG